MAKNQVAPSRPKKRDNFFKKSQSQFCNGKLQQNSVLNIESDNFFIKSDAQSSKNFKSPQSHTSEADPTQHLKKKDNIFKKSQVQYRDSKFSQKYNKEVKVESNVSFLKSENPRTSKEPQLQTSSEISIEKKPFDKKKYRLQKYSKKYKIQQWEDKRKKAVLRGYYKTLNEDEFNTSLTHEKHKENIADVESEKECNSTESNTTEVKNDSPKTSKEIKNKSFRKAHLEFQRIKEEKEKKKELQQKKKLEKEEALQAYKKKKFEKYKRLNKKTKKGQPIMKDRMEMLLEKIQNSIK